MYASCSRKPASPGAVSLRRYTHGGAQRLTRSRLSVERVLDSSAEPSPGPLKVSLARLPKAKAKTFKSLHFRDVTPGSSAKLITDSFQLHRPSAQKPYPSAEWYTDPTHPIHNCSFKDIPKYESAFLRIRAYPFARLAPHSTTMPNPYTEEMKKERRKNQLPMSLIVPMSPHNLHKSGAIRKVVRSRLKEALKLVVVRGAHGSDNSEANSVTLSESNATPEKWVMKDWTYVFKPTLALYKSPMPTIIDEIRIGLQSVKSMGEKLEASWQTREPSPDRKVGTMRQFDRKPSKKPYRR